MFAYKYSSMRPHYLLLFLLVLAEFSRNFDGVLAVGIDGRSKLQKENPDIAESADHYNRFLRGQEPYQSKDADIRIKSEERAGQGLWKQFLGRNDLTIKTFSRMMEDEAYRLKMFQNWSKHKQSYTKIKDRMFLEFNPRFQKLLSEYSSKYALSKAKQVENVKTSTAENVKMATTRVRDPSKPVKHVKWADHQGGTLNEFAKDPVPL